MKLVLDENDIPNEFLEYHLNMTALKHVLQPSAEESAGTGLGDTLADGLRRQIAQWIFDGQLLPGQRLDERGLAEKLSVSRTPVREALRQLQAAGLVEIASNRGAVVAIVDPQRLVELFEVVAEFESICTRLATLRMTPIEKSHIQELLKEEQTAAQAGDIDAFATANRRLHTAIVAGAHNAVLEEAVSGYRIRTAPFRKVQLSLPNRLDETAADDARVVALILQGDGFGAAAALKAHLETTGYYASKCTAATTVTPIKAKRRNQ